MLLYLVRHAIAVDREAHNGYDDASRALTEKGIDKMRRNVRGLDRLGVCLDEIWSSPLLRAHQTADLLAESANFQGQVRTLPCLAPGGDYAQVLRELQQSGDRPAIALVGHEPDLGELLGVLLTGRPTSFITFKKGGVACVEIEKLIHPLKGELRWLLTPKLLRAAH